MQLLYCVILIRTSKPPTHEFCKTESGVAMGSVHIFILLYIFSSDSYFILLFLFCFIH